MVPAINYGQRAEETFLDIACSTLRITETLDNLSLCAIFGTHKESSAPIKSPHLSFIPPVWYWILCKM